jgi:molybdopterin-guanine dinucleotide biosynthesis protein A
LFTPKRESEETLALKDGSDNVLRTKEMSAVILAGGRSSRMGENKMLMPLGSTTVIGHLIKRVGPLFRETIIVTNEPEKYRHYPVRLTEDLICSQEKNSLTGIHTGLFTARSDFSLVMAGDMPFIRTGLLTYLCHIACDYDVTIPREEPHVQPLCAVYQKSCLPHIEKLLYAGRYKVIDFFSAVRVRYVDTAELLPYDAELISFFNVNTPTDYQRAQAMVIQEHKES